MLNVGNGQTIIMEDKWHSKVIAFDLGWAPEQDSHQLWSVIIYDEKESIKLVRFLFPIITRIITIIWAMSKRNYGFLTFK
ncbi:hypothetical protein P344_00795 [Spiroplasma mirum ATCC 29335]|uniref:Uncharacterized protein n=1 Tax=Spiroplasma mirum ATCC 29335 TaxID=838561 RepID=W6AK39_9MOLU|nr:MULTISPECIES: hypothetical protein [Spiroplasma]AHI57532.1 hypothetical protein P344_00795 [Spiroplasma mirum ATCC 29335]